jgi:hypothetical protein
LAPPDSFGLIITVETTSSNLDHDCAAWSKSAEQELGAFLAAVTELFGPDRGRQAAKEWLDELELEETFPVNLSWRHITVAAAIRLALRLNGAVHVDRIRSNRYQSTMEFRAMCGRSY